MKKYNWLLTFIILIFLVKQIYCSTIEGNVSDSRTGNPVYGAFIKIDGCVNKVYFTDSNGNFKIEDLSPGKYLISVGEILRSFKDSIVIKENDEIIKLNIVLKSPIINLNSVSTPELELYHQKIRQFNLKYSVLKIQIDTLFFIDNYLYVQPIITNYYIDTIYLFKDYNCFNILKPIITDTLGNILKQNMILIDCVGEKTCPDSTDLIKIAPNSSTNYPLTKLKFFNFRSIPKGMYSIKIKYEFKEPTEINTYFCRGNSVINTLIKGLRGSYFSNSLIFQNN